MNYVQRIRKRLEGTFYAFQENAKGLEMIYGYIQRLNFKLWGEISEPQSQDIINKGMSSFWHARRLNNRIHKQLWLKLEKNE